MSYQPQPQPPPEVATPGRGLTVAGIVLFVVGLLVGGALFFLSGATEEETVEKFARAPAGCTTTLEFVRADTYLVYLETAGQLQNVGGDCAANGSRYSRADDDPPRASLSFVDSNNTEVPLSAGTGESYDVGGFRGQTVQLVEIVAPGTYRLTVTSDANDFVIAIGGKPDADSAVLTLAAIAAAIAGVVMGFVFLIAGHRAKNSSSGPPTSGQPTSGQPTSGQPTPAPAPGTWPPATPGPGWGAPQQ